MVRNDAVQIVKERVDFVEIVSRYVQLRPNGARLVGPCPFHHETKPSFSVNPEEKLFYCFGCQESGDVFDFYGKINGLDFRETLEQLALEAGVDLERLHGPHDTGKARQAQSKRQQFLRMYQAAAQHFIRNLATPQAEECRAYMDKRGIPPDMAATFGLGWSMRAWQHLADALKRNGFSEALAIESGLLGKSEKTGRGYDRFRGRLMFPIHNLSRQVIAFGGRIIGGEDEAKYINSVDSPIYKKGDHLYGLAQARQGIGKKGRALLTEGYMDVLTLHQFGYNNAVGVLGTALTPEQVKRLSGFTSSLTLLFDGDNAGRKAALRSAAMLLARGLACQVVLLPEGEDIDSLLRSAGPEAFDTLARNAPDGLKFCTDVVREWAPREMVAWARDFLQKVELPELVSPIISHMTQHLGIAEQELRARLGQTVSRRAAPAPTGAAPRKSPLAERDRQILLFAVRYPGRLPDVREYGADLALTTPMGKALWHKLETFNETEIIHHLDAKERAFWVRSRTEGPPLDNGDREFAALQQYLQNFDTTAQRKAFTDALRANARTGDFDTDMEYLRALHETLGNKS